MDSALKLGGKNQTTTKIVSKDNDNSQQELMSFQQRKRNINLVLVRPTIGNYKLQETREVGENPISSRIVTSPIMSFHSNFVVAI